MQRRAKIQILADPDLVLPCVNMKQAGDHVSVSREIHVVLIFVDNDLSCAGRDRGIDVIDRPRRPGVRIGCGLGRVQGELVDLDPDVGDGRVGNTVTEILAQVP